MNIDKKITELENEIEKLKEEIKNTKKLHTDEIYELAEKLHEIFCTHNHIDMCDWHYDNGSWTSFSRREWLGKAYNIHIILKEKNIDLNDVIHISNIIKNIHK